MQKSKNALFKSLSQHIKEIVPALITTPELGHVAGGEVLGAKEEAKHHFAMMMKSPLQ